MKIFFSVGEPSGDLHGANLITELRKQNPNVHCVGFGGPRMREAGCQLHFELTQLAVMFFTEVVSKLPKFFALRKMANEYFRQDPPDAVVLIDFPGFNWHIAKVAKRHGIPVFYYGVPQMWAWAPWRIKKLKRYVDHVLCKLPFEPAWFERRGCRAHDVGHPYFDELTAQRLDQTFLDHEVVKDGGPVLTLLPGSRDFEVERNMPSLLAAALIAQQRIPQLRVWVASFNQAQAEYVRRQIAESELNATVISGKTPELISAATFCIACSGSVSLELMFHQTPTVIVYRISRFKEFLAKRLLRARYITLVNLMATGQIERQGDLYDPEQPAAEFIPFPEYLTTRDCSQKVANWIVRWHHSPETCKLHVDVLKTLKQQYAKSGATKKTATVILKCLTTRTNQNATAEVGEAA